MTDRIDVAGLGLAILDRVYRDGKLVLEDLGGSCGNVTTALAMLGHNVAPVLSLGDDDVGRKLIRGFREAGCVTDYLFAKTGDQSPVIAQTFDEATGDHGFTFTCPETNVRYPRAVPIDIYDLRAADRAFRECRVLFADRASETIIEAMRIVRATGGIVYFEPDPDTMSKGHFAEAMSLATIAKFSAEKFEDMEASVREAGCVSILTMGAKGLRVVDGRAEGKGAVTYSPATPADPFVDACGSGDMTSVGTIDFLLKGERGEDLGPVSSFMDGIVAGQRLASANCSYVGARGAFREGGAAAVRALLDDHA